MPNFQYKIISNGETSVGAISAADMNEAAAILRKGNSFIVELIDCHSNKSGLKSGKPLNLNISVTGWIITSKAVEHSLRYLGVLIKGGVPILSALNICAEQATGQLASSLKATGERIKSGQTLEESMRSEMKFLGQLTLGLVKVGESNGSLDIMFEYASELMERRRKIKNNVIQAMIYPVIVTLMSITAGFYITTVAIPKMMPLLAQKKRALPPITQLLIDVSNFVQNYGVFLIIVPVFFIIALIIARKNKEIGERIDFILLKIPIFGKVFKASVNALWTRSLGILLQSGIDIISAIQLMGRGLVNLHYKKQFVIIGDSVKSGIPFSDSIKNTAIKNLTPLAKSMVLVGENTGTIDDGLLYVAKFNEEDLERRLEFLSKIIEPVLLIIVGGMVGFVYLAFFIGLMAVTRSGGL